MPGTSRGAEGDARRLQLGDLGVEVERPEGEVVDPAGVLRVAVASPCMWTIAVSPR